jgi:tetratricopeptide (TPR) repeat protein
VGDYGVERVWGPLYARVNWLRDAATLPDVVEADVPVTGTGRSLAARHALEQGDAQLTIRLLSTLLDPGGARGRADGIRAAAYLALGDRKQAEAAFLRWLSEFDDMTQLLERGGSLAAASDVLPVLAHNDVLERISEYLAAYPALRYWPTVGGAGPDHLRGAIALRLERADAAEQHFRTGFEWASRPDVRFWLDEGRCHQGLAEVAERRGDHALAMQHLDAAGELFAKHETKLYLDQVLAKKEILRA